MTKFAASTALASALLAAGAAQAQSLTLEITNLTQGIFFTPRLAVTHTQNVDLFEVGEAASAPLTDMAEGGSLDALVTYLDAAERDGENSHTSFTGLLNPATSAAYANMEVGANEKYLSLVAMMLPTNDGFIGLDSWPIPEQAGTYVVYLNAYDAGTESNDEIAANRTDVNGLGAIGAPGFPTPQPTLGSLGTGGTGVAIQIENQQLADESEGRIHIHPGNLGDTDPTGGVSDVDSRVHRWLNPVARLKIVVAD